STTRCPATSAAAGPICAFAKRSSRRRNRADREADDARRSPLLFRRRLRSAVIGERPLPTHLPAGRSRRGRRPDAEPAPGLRLPFACGDCEAAGGDCFAPNAFIRIGTDGQIVLTMPYVEMGQGTYTSIPMLIAEELEVDLKQVRLEHAPPNEKLYGNPLLGGI